MPIGKAVPRRKLTPKKSAPKKTAEEVALAKLPPEEREEERHRLEMIAREQAVDRAMGIEEEKPVKQKKNLHPRSMKYLKGSRPYLYDTATHKSIPMIEIK